MTPDKRNPWLPFGTGDGRLRLFVFPNAGGAASMFRHWRGALGPAVDVCPVLLPGRESRLRETPHAQMDQLIPALLEGIEGAMDRPFAFAGHSMGAAVAFELARRLSAAARTVPRVLVLAGRQAPQLPSRRDPIHNEPDDVFLEHLRELNGTPEEVLANRELMALLMPLLRADFELIETYAVRTDQCRLGVPFLVYGGRDDEDTGADELEAWRAWTTAAVRVEIMHGGHFFLHEDRDRFLRQLAHDLAPFAP